MFNRWFHIYIFEKCVGAYFLNVIMFHLLIENKIIFEYNVTFEIGLIPNRVPWIDSILWLRSRQRSKWHVLHCAFVLHRCWSIQQGSKKYLKMITFLTIVSVSSMVSLLVLVRVGFLIKFLYSQLSPCMTSDYSDNPSKYWTVGFASISLDFENFFTAIYKHPC